MRPIQPCRIRQRSRTTISRRKSARMMTIMELCKLAQSGRKAIEHLLLRILMRPKITTEADIAELNALGALLKHYDEVLSPYLAHPGRASPIDDTNKPAKRPTRPHKTINGGMHAR